MRFNVIVELAPGDYAQVFGLPDQAAAEQHAKKHLPRSVAQALKELPGINPRVTETFELVGPVDTVRVPLTQPQLSAALSALYAAKVENTIYQARTPAQSHDACCAMEAHRVKTRQEMHDALVAHGLEIEGAIAALESKEIR